MDPQAMEFLHLIIRWTHVIVAIAWIGHAFLFTELEGALVRSEDPDDPKDGELWMVHGGGFFQLVKTNVFPKKLVGALHWFKWEAFFTWLSGFFLLSLVYYHGGGIYLVDSSVSSLSYGWAIAVGLGSMVVGWAVYDGLCRTPLLRFRAAFALIGFLLFAGLSYALTHLLSARAAYIHAGAVLGTLMVGNVWMVIIPSMRRMLKGVQPGQKLDASLGKKAKLRSLHNNYLVFPLILIMVSNHFPFAYGHPQAWLVLTGLALLGAGVKHVMNVKGSGWGLALAAIVAMVGMGILQLAAEPEEDDEDDLEFVLPAGNTGPVAGNTGPVAGNTGPAAGNTGPQIPAESNAVEVPRPPAAPGSISGEVVFIGTPPVRERLSMVGGCEMHRDPVYDNSVLVRDGRLQNAFVWISGGLEGWDQPPPREDALIDQRGCMFEPRVVGIQTGQRVRFLNSDDVLHNVKVEAQFNRSYNVAMPQKDMSVRKRFRLAEMMIPIQCDVHPWMRSYLGVCPHPFFKVTGPDGSFRFEGLPPGEYELEVWHEVYGSERQTVVLEQDGKLEVVFELYE